MFRKGWLHRNTIYSDEGFTVSVVGRFAVVYSEGTRKMSIGAEMLADGFALRVNTIGRWENDPSHTVDELKKHEIIANVKRALESQGEKVELLD